MIFIWDENKRQNNIALISWKAESCSMADRFTRIHRCEKMKHGL